MYISLPIHRYTSSVSRESTLNSLGRYLDRGNRPRPLSLPPFTRCRRKKETQHPSTPLTDIDIGKRLFVNIPPCSRTDFTPPSPKEVWSLRRVSLDSLFQEFRQRAEHSSDRCVRHKSQPAFQKPPLLKENKTNGSFFCLLTRRDCLWLPCLSLAQTSILPFVTPKPSPSPSPSHPAVASSPRSSGPASISSP